MRFEKCTETGSELLYTGIRACDDTEVIIENNKGYARSDFGIRNAEYLKWNDINALNRALQIAMEEWS